MTRRLVVDPDTPDAEVVAVAARVLRRGGLVVFPTETFYGLGADALDAAAVSRVFAAKGRPPDKPLLVLVGDAARVGDVAAVVPPRARRLIARHWPGPLTLILPARPELPVELTAGTGTIGVRVPAHPVALALARATARPITAPSANPHGGPSPRTAEEVLVSLGSRVDLVLDAGATPGGLPSTVVDLCREPACVVRLGAVALAPSELDGS